MNDEPRYPIDEPDRSLGDLVGELTGEMSALVTSHIDLAKAELRNDARQAARAGSMFGVAAVVILVALIMLAASVAWGLAEVMPEGWAFLIVGAVLAAAGVVLGLNGRRQIERIEPMPRQTVSELQEDRRWLKTQTG